MNSPTRSYRDHWYNRLPVASVANGAMLAGLGAMMHTLSGLPELVQRVQYVPGGKGIIANPDVYLARAPYVSSFTMALVLLAAGGAARWFASHGDQNKATRTVGLIGGITVSAVVAFAGAQGLENKAKQNIRPEPVMVTPAAVPSSSARQGEFNAAGQFETQPTDVLTVPGRSTTGSCASGTFRNLKGGGCIPH